MLKMVRRYGPLGSTHLKMQLPPDLDVLAQNHLDKKHPPLAGTWIVLYYQTHLLECEVTLKEVEVWHYGTDFWNLPTHLIGTTSRSSMSVCDTCYSFVFKCVCVVHVNQISFLADRPYRSTSWCRGIQFVCNNFQNSDMCYSYVIFRMAWG